MAADGQRPPARTETGGFGIYVHWPFCAAKCPYCDFNSHVAAAIDHPAWATAFEADLRRWATRTAGRTVSSVFFGGGTPSLMAPDTVARVLSTIDGLWPVAPDVEITLEANPTSVERDRLAGFRSAGVNRVSLGVQALDDTALRRLGRLHDAAEALTAVDTARALFDRVSFDLIYARQDQTEATWEAELTRALGLGMDHLSLYQLTIEPGTPFHARATRGRLPGLPDEDRAVGLFELTQSLCDAAGLPAYEVSNHARPGAEGRHNLIYWRGGDWLGIGSGAHGRVTTPSGRVATEALRDPAAWLAARGGASAVAETPVSRAEEAEEYLMMSLRLSEGCDLDWLAKLGAEPDPGARVVLQEAGLISEAAGRLRATPRGRLVLNSVIAALSSG